MPLAITCPNAQCRLALHLPEDAVGKSARCPRCQTVFLVQPVRAPAAVKAGPPPLPAPRPAPAAPPARRPPPPPASVPLAVHAVPGGLLALVVLFLLLRDVIWGPALPPPEQARARVQIEGQDVHDGGPAPGPEVAEAPVDPDPRIRYAYDGLKRFGFTVAQTGKRLTYDTAGRTNMTVLQVDGAAEVFGAVGQWASQEGPPPPGPAANYHSKNVWLGPQGIQVTQVLDLVPSKQPVEIAPGQQRRLLDTCLVAFQLENRDARPHAVGLRLEIDTLIGSNDGVPFTVPGLPGLVNTFADFRAADKGIPDFVQALEVPDLQNPGTVAHLTLKVGGGLEPPDRVSLTHWTGGNRAWDVGLSPMGNDSAVILYWSGKELPPGARRSVGFAYGLGTVVSDAGQGKGKLGLTLAGGFEPGETFTLTAYVEGAAPGQELTLKLPAGLERVEGDERQPVPAAQAPGAASLVTWRVRVRQTGRFPLEVQSSTGLSQRRVLTITRPDPARRPAGPDNIFR